MSSPRSMWSGTIRLGLIPVPVTIGKAWQDQRETSLRDVCASHSVPIDRTERCTTPKCKLEGGKAKAVQLPSGEWRKISDAEMAQIEADTKADTLDILDVQKVYDLPIDYATGTYYIRFDQKAKGFDARPFAHLQATLVRNDLALVVKWCSSSRQRLAFVTGEGNGALLLRTIPYANELREATGTELFHMQEQIDEAVIEQMKTLLDGMAQSEFKHSAYSDDGAKLRSDAVDKVLKGEGGEQQNDERKQEGGNVPDLMAALKASMEEQKLHQGEGEKQNA